MSSRTDPLQWRPEQVRRDCCRSSFSGTVIRAAMAVARSISYWNWSEPVSGTMWRWASVATTGWVCLSRRKFRFNVVVRRQTLRPEIARPALRRLCFRLACQQGEMS